MNSHQTVVDAIVTATGFTKDHAAHHAKILLNAVMNRLGRAQEIDSIDHEPR